MGLEAFKAIGPVVGMLGGPVLANMFAPEGQELNSFSGKGSQVDPVALMTEFNRLFGNIGQGITDRAASPISLPSAVAQQPGVYTGGGLPLPIGLSSIDPALANPSLLSLQGLGQFERTFTPPKQGPTGPTDPNPPPVNPDPTGPKDPTQYPASPSMTTRRRGLEGMAGGQLVRGQDLLTEESGDDLDQAYGAVNLLLESLRGGGDAMRL